MYKQKGDALNAVLILLCAFVAAYFFIYVPNQKQLTNEFYR